MKYPLLLLGLILITLKLTGYIAWSWLWVLAPMWIPPVLALLVYLLVLGVFVKIMKRQPWAYPRSYR